MIGYIALIAVTILVFAFVLHPLLFGQYEAVEMPSGRVADLSARRQYILDSLREVEFDFASGKVGEAEYQETRSRYVQEAAVVLRELDNQSRQLDEEIDAEIAELRRAARSGRSSQDESQSFT